MPCRLVGFAIVVLAFASQSLGFEVGAVIRKIDINQRVAQVFANGKDRAIRIAGDAKILDKNGKDLSGGLGATELKEGSTVTLTVELDGNTPTIVSIRLGGKVNAPTRPNAPARISVGKTTVGFKPLTEMTAQDRYKGEDAGPSGELHEHGKQLDKDTRTVLVNLKNHFSNLRIAYLGSRIYGGYADGRLNPEPYAYEGAFVVRWLIQSQIKTDPGLNYAPERGAVKSPLLLWGPYFWADGVTPRKSDGLIWERSDLVGDGTHPSNTGRQKVAEQLLNFFKTDAYARTWFVKK